MKGVAERLGIDYREALELAGVTSEPISPTDRSEPDAEEAKGPDISEALEVLRRVAEDPEKARAFAAAIAAGLEQTESTAPDTDVLDTATGSDGTKRDTA